MRLSVLLNACLAALVERNLCIGVSSCLLHCDLLLQARIGTLVPADLFAPTSSPGVWLCQLQGSRSLFHDPVLYQMVHQGLSYSLDFDHNVPTVYVNTEHSRIVKSNCHHTYCWLLSSSYCSVCPIKVPNVGFPCLDMYV